MISLHLLSLKHTVILLILWAPYMPVFILPLLRTDELEVECCNGWLLKLFVKIVMHANATGQLTLYDILF